MLNQEAKADANKLQLSLVPPAIITSIAKVRQYGTEKYKDPDNWRKVEIERYWEAVLRHICAAWSDFRKRDPESSLMHIEHASCNLAFMLQKMSEEGIVIRSDGMSINGKDIAQIWQDVVQPFHVSVTPALVEDPIEPETAADVKPEAPPEPLKKPRQRVDRGAVKALRAKGWTIKEIANDPLVQCSEQTVRNILNDKE